MQTQHIKSAQICEQKKWSKATLYRMWKVYKVLPPPTVIRGINYWTPQEVEQAFRDNRSNL